MKCKNCGAEIPKGFVYCEKCGAEVQMVPDYNPLDDVLTAQVRGALENQEALMREQEYQKRREAKKLAAQEKRRKERAKKRKRILSIFAAIAAVCGISYFIYLNTYHGLVNSGNKYLAERDYESASRKFKQAMKQDDSTAEAYNGLAKAYIALDKAAEAENLYLHAIKKYSANVELYRGCILLYQETDQMSKIPLLLDKCDDDGVLDDLHMYVSNEPKFSLEEKLYDVDQELSLTAKGQAIYYTTDGTEPTAESTLYTEPIQIREGTTTVSAIAVNEEGVPSMVVSKTYIIEAPIADAPAVSPSTGYYERPMQIVVQVPSGYTAYYTISSTDGPIDLPTTSSTKYTGPVDMPEGNHIFCAVLVDSRGRLSEVKKMNYELEIQ